MVNSRSNKGSAIGFLSTALLPLLLLALSFSGGVLWAAPPPQQEGIEIPNPGTDLWREVRQRSMSEPAAGPTQPRKLDVWQEVQPKKVFAPPAGVTQAQGVDTAALINPLGDQWRQFRMDRLLPYGSYLLAGMLVFLILFYFIRGRVPIHAGPSDKQLFRYTVFERTAHWFLAFLFLFLAVTGLILLFGRPYLLPLLGPKAFSVLASASKEGHNLFGPVFALAFLLIFVRFVRRNIYQRGDLSWLLRGGGIIGKKHVPSNFFNMGEKTMFWLLVFVGGTIAVSGFVLLFPNFGQGRELMALSHFAHGIAAILMLAVIMGHIYIGSIGMEGALDGMKTGYCDLNWAREHHDWWAQKCEEKGEVVAKSDTAARQHGTASEPELESGEVAK